jgi:LAGLIDADG DNA endonuclease family
VGNTVGSLSEAQHSLVIGSLLGDGSMRCKIHALLEINHSASQRGYVDWKYRHLAELVATPPLASSGERKPSCVSVCDAKPSFADAVLRAVL